MKWKKFFILSLCLCFCLPSFFFSIRKGNNTVKADYNLFNIHSDTITTQNANYTLTETGFIIETVSIGASASYINYYYDLLPNTDYVLTYVANTLVEGSTNIIAVYNSDNVIIRYVANSNTANFKTDLSGKGRILFYAFDNVPTKIYKTEYSNIVLRFADEQLGSVYEQAYSAGYSEGSKPPEVVWEPYPLTDDSLSTICYEDNASITGGMDDPARHRSSALYTLPLGYYKVEQKCLPDYFDMNFPTLYPPQLVFDTFSPIVYLDQNYYHVPLEIIGNVKTDRYIYFYVPFDNCQIRFQFASNNLGAWNSSYNALNQIIALYFDVGYNNQYLEGYNKGYEAGQLSGFLEGEKKGSADGFTNGYSIGYDEGTQDGYNSGYSEGYDFGYNEGYNSGISGSVTTSWFTSFVNSTFDIFNIEIFPNVKLAYLFFVPVGLGILFLILKLVRG